MKSLPLVTSAEYQGDYKIRLRFSDEVEGTVDFKAWLVGPVFEALLDEEQFKRFFIDAGTISWPNGADVAPETLYERAKADAAA